MEAGGGAGLRDGPRGSSGRLCPVTKPQPCPDSVPAVSQPCPGPVPAVSRRSPARRGSALPPRVPAASRAGEALRKWRDVSPPFKLLKSGGIWPVILKVRFRWELEAPGVSPR